MVACFDRLVPDLPPADFIKHALSITVHPMAQPCPLPSRLVNTIVSAAKLAEDLVAHRWKLFEIVLKNNMNFLLRAKLGGQVSLAICLRYLAVGTFLFFFFSACWTKLATRTNTCCTTSPASLSPVLRLFLALLSPKSVHSTVSLSEFWSNVPQRNVELLNRVGPTRDTELDRRASDKNTRRICSWPYGRTIQLP